MAITWDWVLTQFQITLSEVFVGFFLDEFYFTFLYQDICEKATCVLES